MSAEEFMRMFNADLTDEQIARLLDAARARRDRALRRWHPKAPAWASRMRSAYRARRR